MQLSKENQCWLKWLTGRRKNMPILMIELRSQKVVAKLILFEKGFPKTITSKSKKSLDEAITQVKSKFGFYNLEKAI
ncbi:MAG: hypothetical protein AABW56_02245, partial [Nanoarchaeota archaeon]